MERTLAEINGGRAAGYRAFLFDLDGTVADSMPLHLVAWQQAVREYGGEFPKELFYAWGGIPQPRTVEMLNERYELAMPVTEVVERKEGLYLERIAELMVVESMAETIATHYGKVRFAIVSGSARASIELVLGVLGLRDRFELIVGAEDYLHGKPAPEPFLTAATRLGVAAEECLVFEDAEAGIASAVAARMDWVRVVAEADSLRG